MVTTARPAVVVLAAGHGSRFQGDSHKLEQPFDADGSVLARTLRHVIGSHLPFVTVVSQRLAPVAQQLVAARDLVVVPPELADGPSAGMGLSIACGVGARPEAPGWLLLPADMPLVRSSSLLAVAAALQHHPIAYAQHRGRRGHPVGFAAELYSELATLSGDAGARRLLARYPAHGVELDDPGVLVDVDTVDDLRAARAMHVGGGAARPLELRPD